MLTISAPPETRSANVPAAARNAGPDSLAARLGSAQFRADYGLRYSYLTGAMYRGIASKELVVAMGRAGLLGFMGTGGLAPEQLRADIGFIRRQLGEGQAWGMNLIANVGDPALEMRTAQLFVELAVPVIEASAFMQVTPALVYFRAHGLAPGPDGRRCRGRILAKLSSPEVARAFMSPPPERIVARLLADGRISEEQARLVARVPVGHDICVEADSGGHTDQGVALVMLSGIQRLRRELGHGAGSLRVGLAGGIGTPEAVAAAFVMGADFVMTGSINQCTAEAATSDAVKDMLQDIDIRDTAYAPAGDMFEMGAKVQVLRKGVFFPARANRLYQLYTQYDGIEALPAAVREQLEAKYFRQPLEEVWRETRGFFHDRGRLDEIEKAQNNPKHRMSLVFRWYFGHSMRVAFAGDQRHKLDFQIHTGPALGAFNRWVQGSPWENWRGRHVDQIAEKLMVDAAALMVDRLRTLQPAPH